MRKTSIRATTKLLTRFIRFALTLRSAQLQNDAEVELFEAHFHKRKSAIEGTEDAEPWQKIRPKDSYVVRTFDEVISNTSPLPYDKVSASPAFDIWSLGTIIYAFCSGTELFNTNRDTDCEDGAALASLYTWTDEIKQKTIFKNVNNSLAQSLLMKMLSANPTDRFKTMAEVLSHPFFAVDGSGVVSAPVVAIDDGKVKELQLKIDDMKKANQIETDKVRALENQVAKAKRNSIANQLNENTRLDLLRLQNELELAEKTIEESKKKNDTEGMIMIKELLELQKQGQKKVSAAPRVKEK